MHYKLLFEFALLVFVSVYVIWVIACAITHEMDGVPKWFTATAALAAIALYFI